MNEETGFLAAVLRELAASTAVILAAWGALGGATNALTTKMNLRDALRHILLGGLIAAGMGSFSMALVTAWLGLPPKAIPAGGAADVLRAVKVPLAPHEFDALVSFHYNTGGIARAALTRHLNAGEREAAAEAFLNWRRPAAIIPRREAERDLFRHGRYPEGTIPVWSVDRAGRVDFSRPARQLSEAQALALLHPANAVPPPVARPAPDAPTGWLARLVACLLTLIRRA